MNCLIMMSGGDVMKKHNHNQYPEYIDLSCYPAQYKVFAKQLERQEQLLIEIRDAILSQNKPKRSKKQK